MYIYVRMCLRAYVHAHILLSWKNTRVQHLINTLINLLFAKIVYRSSAPECFNLIRTKMTLASSVQCANYCKNIRKWLKVQEKSLFAVSRAIIALSQIISLNSIYLLFFIIQLKSFDAMLCSLPFLLFISLCLPICACESLPRYISSWLSVNKQDVQTYLPDFKFRRTGIRSAKG